MGIATLTIASLLKGILEIAGTDSPYLKYYYIVGWAFLASGLIVMTGCLIKYHQYMKH